VHPLIAHLFIGWIASIAAFLTETIERINTGWFAFRAFAFIVIRHAAGDSSCTAARPLRNTRRIAASRRQWTASSTSCSIAGAARPACFNPRPQLPRNMFPEGTVLPARRPKGQAIV
jgi:hypothetical protein